MPDEGGGGESSYWPPLGSLAVMLTSKIRSGMGVDGGRLIVMVADSAIRSDLRDGRSIGLFLLALLRLAIQ